MYPQIRITKTPKLKSNLKILTKHYPTLEENEIIKYLIGKETVEISKMKEDDYLRIVKNSPSYGRLKLEEDRDEEIYSASDAKPLRS